MIIFQSYSSSRKKITHETLFSSSQNAKVNVCLYMHCSPGEKCQISANGRASCICRSHCKPTEKVCLKPFMINSTFTHQYFNENSVCL